MARQIDSQVETPAFPRWIIVGWATIFLVGTDLFIVSPFLPLMGREMGRSPQSLTVLVSVFSLVYALACPIQGRVAERFGPRAVLIFGVAALACSNAYTALAPDFEHLIASRVVAGFAAASISPMIYALTANSAEPARRASRLAFVNSGLIVSLILGAPVGLLFGNMTQWRWVFLSLAVVLAVMVPINVATWARPTTGSSPQNASQNNERLSDAWPLVAGMAAWAASVYMTYTLLGTVLATRLHLNTWAMSLVLSIFGLGATIGVFSGGKLADQIGAARVTRISFSAMAVMFCLSAFAFQFGSVMLFVLGIFFIGLSAYGFFPAIQATAATVFVARRSTVLGLMSSALYAGITLGSFVGGKIFDRQGMGEVLIASAIASGLGLVFVWTLPKLRDPC